MSTNRGSRVTTTGLAVMMLAVSAGVGSGHSGALLGLAGVLVGANLVAVGVRRMGEEPTKPTGSAGFPGVDSVTASLRRNLAVVGIILASSATTAAAGGPVLCFAMFAVLLLGLSLIMISIRVRGEY